MKKEIYNIEGIEIEVEKYDKNDKNAKHRRLAYCFRMIREKSGITLKCFYNILRFYLTCVNLYLKKA